MHLEGLWGSGRPGQSACWVGGYNHGHGTFCLPAGCCTWRLRCLQVCMVRGDNGVELWGSLEGAARTPATAAAAAVRCCHCCRCGSSLSKTFLGRTTSWTTPPGHHLRPCRAASTPQPPHTLVPQCRAWTAAGGLPPHAQPCSKLYTDLRRLLQVDLRRLLQVASCTLWHDPVWLDLCSQACQAYRAPGSNRLQ